MSKIAYLNTVELVEKHNYMLLGGTDIIAIVVDEKIVGHVEFRDDGDNEIFIEMIEIAPSFQNQGYSSLLLNQIVNNHPDTVAFNGESTYEAVPYWKSNGAMFDPSLFTVYHEDVRPEIYEGILFPFVVSLHDEHTPYWENVG